MRVRYPAPVVVEVTEQAEERGEGGVGGVSRNTVDPFSIEKSKPFLNPSDAIVIRLELTVPSTLGIALLAAVATHSMRRRLSPATIAEIRTHTPRNGAACRIDSIGQPHL